MWQGVFIHILNKCSLEGYVWRIAAAGFHPWPSAPSGFMAVAGPGCMGLRAKALPSCSGYSKSALLPCRGMDSLPASTAFLGRGASSGLRPDSVTSGPGGGHAGV